MLVGRASEVEVLAGALKAACEGRGGMVFVVGEAGIGKSRLVQEVSSAAEQRGVPVMRGRAVPGSGGAAFRHLTEALTIAVVEHLSHHLARAPVLCVATLRSEELSPARDVVRRVAAGRTSR